MVAADRVAAINPPIDDMDPIRKFNIDPGKPHGPAKPSRTLSKREADTECQYRPHIVDTDTIAEPIFADATSETYNLSYKRCFGLRTQICEGQKAQQTRFPENFKVTKIL